MTAHELRGRTSNRTPGLGCSLGEAPVMPPKSILALLLLDRTLPLGLSATGVTAQAVSGAPVHGHKPLARNGQERFSSLMRLESPACCAILRHCPGLAPNRFLKHELNNPR